MTLATLKALFRPRSVAVLGASREGTGACVLRNLLQAEFEGPVLPVSAEHQSLLGVLCHKRIEELPLPPDLAVICGPALPAQLEALGRRGTRAAILVSDAPDAAALHKAARKWGLRFLGPGSTGIQVPGAHLDASWMCTRASPGSVALVAQSGALIAGMLPWAGSRSIGFSHVVSCGEGADVDLGDVLDYLAIDAQARALLLYVRELHDARKFLSAARALARIKPVIVIKPAGGNGETGVVFPSGEVLPGVDPDAVYDTAIQRAGMLRVRDIDELFDAAETLTRGRRPRGERLAIIGNGLGPAEMAASALREGGGTVARVTGAAACGAIDLGREATARAYRDTVLRLLGDPSVDALLVMHAATAQAPDEACAAEVIEAAKSGERLVFTCWLGADPRGEAQRAFTAAGVANYRTPEKAARAFLRLVSYQRNQYLLQQTPSTPAPGSATQRTLEAARELVDGALDEGRLWLHEEEARALLDLYGIRAAPAKLAAWPEDAARIARELGYPVRLRLSMRPPGQHHELYWSDAAVREAAEALFAEPGAELAGTPGPRVVVETVRPRPDALTLMAGIATDPVFGRVIHLGPGGLQKSIQEGGALALPPLNMALAEAMVSRTRIAQMVAQSFDRAGLDVRALQSLLVQLSDLAVDLPEVTLLQINPLFADRDGVLAQDVHLALERPRPGRPVLAIRPYPSELEEELVLKDGGKVLARPVRPEDEPAYSALLARMSREDLYSRFGKAGPVPHEVTMQLIHIDYDREMTFVAMRGEEMLGAVDTMTSADNGEAEYGIFVRTDVKRTGLGRALMEKMIRYCRQRGTGSLYGMVLKTNVPMLSLDFKLGFSPDLRAEPDEYMEKMVLKL